MELAQGERSTAEHEGRKSWTGGGSFEWVRWIAAVFATGNRDFYLSRSAFRSICLASFKSIRALRPCFSSRCSRLLPLSKVRGLSLANSYASGPKSAVVTKIPLFAPSFIRVPYRSRTAETPTVFV